MTSEEPNVTAVPDQVRVVVAVTPAPIPNASFKLMVEVSAIVAVKYAMPIPVVGSIVTSWVAGVAPFEARTRIFAALPSTGTFPQDVSVTGKGMVVPSDTGVAGPSVHVSALVKVTTSVVAGDVPETKIGAKSVAVKVMLAAAATEQRNMATPFTTDA